jgi:hypothetical protein
MRKSVSLFGKSEKKIPLGDPGVKGRATLK